MKTVILALITIAAMVTSLVFAQESLDYNECIEIYPVHAHISRTARDVGFFSGDNFELVLALTNGKSILKTLKFPHDLPPGFSDSINTKKAILVCNNDINKQPLTVALLENGLIKYGFVDQLYISETLISKIRKTGRHQTLLKNNKGIAATIEFHLIK